jgi:protein-tyrosine phosphatase
LGITHIVSVGRSPHSPVKHGSFILYEIPRVEDLNTNRLDLHFPAVFQFMREALKCGGSIFVHCEMGLSRGATVMIGFLRANGDSPSLQISYETVKRIRPWIAPNAGFQDQLRHFFCEPLITEMK